MKHLLKIDQIRIDSKRCRIERDGQSYILEPKVMDVLMYLIQHRGHVCTQEDIFLAVWPKGIYSQSSVQRCIALARKAIGDNAQNPTYICTHQRRGYSFECKKVDEINAQKNVDEKIRGWLKHSSIKSSALLLGLVLVLSLLAIWWFFLSSNIKEFETYKAQPMTSSTEAAFYGVYSPDGQWIAYIKDTSSGEHDTNLTPPELGSVANGGTVSQQGVIASIWLINRSSNQHQLLYNSQSSILTLSWSPDSQSVYFSGHDSDGYHIDVKPIQGGSEVRRLVSREPPNQFWRPIVMRQPDSNLNSNNIYFIESSLPLNQKSQTELKVFNEATGVAQSLLASSAKFTPYRLAHCSSQGESADFLVVAGEAEHSMVSIRLFDLSQLQLGAELATFPLGFTEIRCDSSNNRLLVAHNYQLYWLDFDGTKSMVGWDNFHTIYNPDIAPSSNRLLVSQAMEDVDLGIYSVAEKKLNRVFDNKVNDRVARISKNGVLAVNSTRSGVMQTFLQSHQTLLLFDNPHSLPLNSPPIWSVEGERLLIHQQGRVHIFSKDGQSIISQPIMSAIIRVHDWFDADGTLLVSARMGHEDWFGIYHLESQQFEKVLLTGTNAWARFLSNGDVIAVQEARIVSVNNKREKRILLELDSNEYLPVPIDQGFLIQVGNQVVQYTNQAAQIGDFKRRKVITTLPEKYPFLVDANRSGELLLLATSLRQDMDLIQLELVEPD
jgi:DNA-binding winged helix-turn-helix (wHTH) protein